MSSLSFSLQLGTLMPVLLGVTLVRVLAMGHYALHRRVYPGFRVLMWAPLLVFVGMALLLLRALVGESPLLVFFTNVILLAHPVLEYHGVGEYARVPHLRSHTLQNACFVLLVSLAQMADSMFDPNMERRAVIFSGAALLLTLRIGLELPWRSRRRLPGLKILCFSYLITAGLQVLRGYNVLAIPGYSLLTMQQGDVIGIYSVFFRILQSALELYVVFAMNSAMLEDDLHVATAQIERMAHTDALTGVLNRRGLELLGAEALRKSYALAQSVAVIMIDLDWFKNVNDSLGHAAGDELLRAVSALCAGALRREDVFARYGGEEFVVVAPQTSVAEAQRLAQRMRLAIESAHFEATGGVKVTASFGVACTHGGDLEQLLKKADAAMYMAKQTGRNKVVIAVPEAQDAVRELDAVEG